MKRKIHKLKVWLIHKLGGYTQDEAVHNRKIEHLMMYHSYTTNLYAGDQANLHVYERDKAIAKFADTLKSYVRIQERRDHITDEWMLRLSLRVVDEDRM